MIKRARSKKPVFPTEVMWFIFLLMGVKGAFTIIQERFMLFYEEFSGQQALIVGYFLAVTASVGLHVCHKGMKKAMKQAPRLSRLFCGGYVVCLALPFIFDHLKLPRPMEVVLSLCCLVFILFFGHVFYSKLKGIHNAKTGKGKRGQSTSLSQL